MTEEQNMLWNKIKAFELDDDASDLTFTDRLVRENGWRYEFAVSAIEEYKRFIFLVCISHHSLTPSDAVDQVWHLHLLYTHSYWNDLCGTVLKREIHHGPTRGGNGEKLKYQELYSKTLELYKTIFSQKPPADVWPDPTLRFARNKFQRVDLTKHWMIKKPFS